MMWCTSPARHVDHAAGVHVYVGPAQHHHLRLWSNVRITIVTYHNRYIRELSETFAQQIIVIASNAQNPSSARVCLIQYKLLWLRAVSS